MLTDQEEESAERPPEQEGVPEARVARSRSGSDHHNTLTPRWEFDFSV